MSALTPEQEAATQRAVDALDQIVGGGTPEFEESAASMFDRWTVLERETQRALASYDQRGEP